jgi:hypothetical protein
VPAFGGTGLARDLRLPDATCVPCSASCGGGALRPQSVYHRERVYFLERWRHVIRDDPYFNPSLSLYDRTPRLG